MSTKPGELHFVDPDPPHPAITTQTKRSPTTHLLTFRPLPSGAEPYTDVVDGREAEDGAASRLVEREVDVCVSRQEGTPPRHRRYCTIESKLGQ